MGKLVDRNIAADNGEWTFDGIVEEFDQHVRRSVPQYDLGHDLVCKLSDFFLPYGASIVDLGMATGNLSKKLLNYHRKREDISLTGIDWIDDMVREAKKRCSDDHRATFTNGNIVTFNIEPSSMIISYLTLQFIHPRSRQAIFEKVYQSLEPGGAFFLFEKIRAPTARLQDIMGQLYLDFKLEQGFNEAEIVNKQRSLKGVLEPLSTHEWLDMAQKAGFTEVATVMRYICFEGILAIK